MSRLGSCRCNATAVDETRASPTCQLAVRISVVAWTYSVLLVALSVGPGTLPNDGRFLVEAGRLPLVPGGSWRPRDPPPSDAEHTTTLKTATKEADAIYDRLPSNSETGSAICQLNGCWDRFHGAVDAALAGLSRSDVYDGDWSRHPAGGATADDPDGSDNAEHVGSDPSAKLSDRLMLTSAYCDARSYFRRTHHHHAPTRTTSKPNVTQSVPNRAPRTRNDGSSSSAGRPKRGRNWRREVLTDPEPETGGPGVLDAQRRRRRLCEALRSLIGCVDHSRHSCGGQLISFHSLRQMARSNLERCGCRASVDDVDETNGAGSGGHATQKSRSGGSSISKDPEELMDDPSTVDGVSTNAGNMGVNWPSVPDACRYHGGSKSPSSTGTSPRPYDDEQPIVCTMFGDPHIRTFQGTFQTCRTAGTWPLIDNDFVTVHVTNSLVGQNAGTAVTKVAVIVKPYSNCSAPPGHYLVYMAEQGKLPSHWDPDSSYSPLDSNSGLESSADTDFGSIAIGGVILEDVDPGEQVKIHLLHISSTVSIRVISRYYMVTIVAPPELVRPHESGISTSFNPTSKQRFNGSSVFQQESVRGIENGNSSSESKKLEQKTYPTSAAVQLCVSGCPRRETVDLSGYFRRSLSKGATGSSDHGRNFYVGVGTGKRLISVHDVQRTCVTDSGLVGFFVDSCVFDLLNSGDIPFATVSAQTARLDILRFSTAVMDGVDSNSLFGSSLFTGINYEDDRKSAPDLEAVFDYVPLHSSAVEAVHRFRLNRFYYLSPSPFISIFIFTLLVRFAAISATSILDVR